MANEDISVGDVVRLKSGGPRMTVAKIEQPTVYSEDLVAACIWFEGDKPMKYDGVFRLHALEKIAPD